MSSRNYRKEYDAYYGAPGAKSTWTATQRAHRLDKSGRSRARKVMELKYGKAKLKGMDVDHRNCNPQDNRLSNLIIRPIGVNRDGSKCKAKRRHKRV